MGYTCVLYNSNSKLEPRFYIFLCEETVHLHCVLYGLLMLQLLQLFCHPPMCHGGLYRRCNCSEMAPFFSDRWGGMTSRHVKKVVVCVAELIAALVPIHGLLTFHTDMNGLP